MFLFLLSFGWLWQKQKMNLVFLLRKMNSYFRSLVESDRVKRRNTKISIFRINLRVFPKDDFERGIMKLSSRENTSDCLFSHFYPVDEFRLKCKPKDRDIIVYNMICIDHPIQGVLQWLNNIYTKTDENKSQYIITDITLSRLYNDFVKNTNFFFFSKEILDRMSRYTPVKKDNEFVLPKVKIGKMKFNIIIYKRVTERWPIEQLSMRLRKTDPILIRFSFTKSNTICFQDKQDIICWF
jgi:hypothetical protein